MCNYGGMHNHAHDVKVHMYKVSNNFLTQCSAIYFENLKQEDRDIILMHNIVYTLYVYIEMGFNIEQSLSNMHDTYGMICSRLCSNTLRFKDHSFVNLHLMVIYLFIYLFLIHHSA